MLTAEEIGAWPGKTIDDALHPALWHMLDVGAVARRLTAKAPLTGNPSLDDAFVFLVALHDLGKFSANFREMLRGNPPSGFRHWQHTYRLLRNHDQDVASLVGGAKGSRKSSTPPSPAITEARPSTWTRGRHRSKTGKSVSRPSRWREK